MFHSTSRRAILQSAALWAVTLASLCANRQALAQAAPGPLRIICSGPAGSIPDIVARRIAEQLGGAYPQGVVVDNRPGAAGQIAVNALKAAPSDGSTLLLAQGAVVTVYPYLYPKLAYDPVRDLQPVSLAGAMTLALAIGPAVPNTVTNLREFMAWLRSNPKLAHVASPGSGTLPHVLEAMLFSEADVAWQHVVYAGGPPAMVDLLGGQIAALVLPEGLFRQHKATGKVRVLATSGAERSSFFPDVPSFAEAGYHNVVVREWFAFFMPANASSAVIHSAAKALKTAISSPELVAAFAEAGMQASASAPELLTARIAAEQGYWQPRIRSMGLKVEL